MMTLQEAIDHCKEMAERCPDECGAEHRRLAEWLQELQDRREAEPGRLTDDLISRQAAIDALYTCRDTHTIDTTDGYTFIDFEQAENLISELPSAEKRGNWVRHWNRPGVYADLLWHCSACGGRTGMSWAHIYYKYCPYCGARMEARNETD